MSQRVSELMKKELPHVEDHGSVKITYSLSPNGLILGIHAGYLTFMMDKKAVGEFVDELTDQYRKMKEE
ncbi:hypothetical protein EVB32_133 [Rhizobium phage RHph_TM39]|nr:hypothetical protein PQC16_gp133 [Rhizobium phage RHph_TM30]QIG71604.1 hypothetical protein EVB94_133 [Rhizobium phage RHph_TM40]QIG71967.1 hypothetical protein EVB95_133 [Rhizobium phage RHph_TM2_3B]QIG72329.1 hypothetical protein EVB96_133 [Rhizobium phage RHph_TM3_3_6]QIG77121.1 hypothetical protein EVB32_133 [Rhizobium phage RHph_TM39]QIG77457.1 hypothetical protein EVB61_129 [Rhizobium phage RHph_TM21B]QIG77719.1 hypothetical protein EVB64_132 [Rhizobium phage RHph_TM61]